MTYTFHELEYKRPDMTEVLAAAKTRLQAFKESQTPDEQYNHWLEFNEIFKEFESASTLVHIRHTMDTNDEFYTKEADFFDENGPAMTEIQVEFYHALLASPFRSSLAEKVGEHVFSVAEQTVLTFKPEIKELLVQENKLNNEYDHLRASAQIPFNGEVLTLAQMIPHTMSADPKTRKEAVTKVTEFFAENLAAFDDIYDRMVKVRTEMARTLGFENYIPLGYARMGRLDYGPEDVAVYRQSVLDHIVPLAGKLRARQAKRIGVEHLTYFDEAYEFPNGNPCPIGTEEELLVKAQKMYRELSTETGEFFDFMLDHQLMDLQAKKGKNGGGYCTFLPSYKAPFIFSNFNGTADDVDVLTHEAGHAFQVFRSRNMLLPEYVWPTMEACEIHSMSMEFLTWNWMDLFFGEKTNQYNFSHLAAAILFIPYGILVDHFQHEVYAHPEMTPEERRATWRRLEKQYLPTRDYQDLEILNEGAFWFRQSHIFTMPFYYIDYTLAQNCALQFWRMGMQDLSSALEKYLRLCDQGGRYSFLKLLEIADLKNPFKAETLPEVVHFIDEYLENITEESLK